MYRDLTIVPRESLVVWMHQGCCHTSILGNICKTWVPWLQCYTLEDKYASFFACKLFALPSLSSFSPHTSASQSSSVSTEVAYTELNFCFCKKKKGDIVKCRCYGKNHPQKRIKGGKSSKEKVRFYQRVTSWGNIYLQEHVTRVKSKTCTTHVKACILNGNFHLPSCAIHVKVRRNFHVPCNETHGKVHGNFHVSCPMSRCLYLHGVPELTERFTSITDKFTKRFQSWQN